MAACFAWKTAHMSIPTGLIDNTMKAFITTLFASLPLLGVLLAEPLYVSSINFKGRIEGQSFEGRDFNVELKDRKFKIRCQRGENGVFELDRNDNSILDLVFSPKCSAVAVALRATDSNSRRRSLVTIASDGEKRSFNYKAYEMSERLGWIVELGSVSDDGERVLAKCAWMLPENDAGISNVQHGWMILRIGEEEIEVFESESALDRWHKAVQSRN